MLSAVCGGEAGLSAETLEGLQIVSEAFGERPVWSTQHLEERGASISAQGIEAALRETAYVFQKGTLSPVDQHPTISNLSFSSCASTPDVSLP